MSELLHKYLERIHNSMLAIEDDISSHTKLIGVYLDQVSIFVSEDKVVPQSLVEHIQFLVENINMPGIKYSTELMEAAIENIIEMRIEE